MMTTTTTTATLPVATDQAGAAAKPVLATSQLLGAWGRYGGSSSAGGSANADVGATGGGDSIGRGNTHAVGSRRAATANLLRTGWAHVDEELFGSIESSSPSPGPSPRLNVGKDGASSTDSDGGKNRNNRSSSIKRRGKGEEGRVCCISGPGKKLSFALLISQLLASPTAQVALIVTTASFDVVELYYAILTRLRLRLHDNTHQRGEGEMNVDTTSKENRGRDSKRSSEQGHRLENEASHLLERVQIMRVFDFLGLEEAVAEIRDGLEREVEGAESVEGAGTDTGAASAPGTTTAIATETATETVPMDVETTKMEPSKPDIETSHETVPRPVSRTPAVRKRRMEVADSEDEDEDEDDEVDNNEDDEMLFGGEVQTTLTEEEMANTTDKTDDVKEQQLPPPQLQNGERIEMIVIDSITHVVMPLMNSNFVQAQAFLASFLRSLTNLTRSHGLAALVLNSTVPVYQLQQQQQQQQQGQQGQQQQQYAQRHHSHGTTITSRYPSPSIFADNPIQPALGKTFPYFLDLHLLVSQRRMERGGKGGKEMAEVVEVLADRWHGRAGRWAILPTTN